MPPLKSEASGTRKGPWSSGSFFRKWKVSNKWVGLGAQILFSPLAEILNRNENITEAFRACIVLVFSLHWFRGMTLLLSVLYNRTRTGQEETMPQGWVGSASFRGAELGLSIHRSSNTYESRFHGYRIGLGRSIESATTKSHGTAMQNNGFRVSRAFLFSGSQISGSKFWVSLLISGLRFWFLGRVFFCHTC